MKKDIDQYIMCFPLKTQKILKTIRNTIRQTAPEATEAIKYGIPTFIQKGNLVHFAAFKTHIGFYPTPSGIEKFKKEIIKYKWAKGSVQFPLHQSIPYELIKKMVLFRISETK